MKLFLKILGWVFGILCAISAVLQYNDPDPLLWMVIYGAAALTSFAVALNRIFFTVPLVFGILTLLGSFYLYPSDFQGFDLSDGDITTVELGREAFGLLIIAIVMFFFAFGSRYLQKSKV